MAPCVPERGHVRDARIGGALLLAGALGSLAAVVIGLAPGDAVGDRALRRG
ncbi:MAG: hypothetical protein QM607_13830 [Microbacterium sp.]